MSTRSPFIVAELSANHLGSLKRAHEIVRAARQAGADAVKFQTWTPDTMCVDPSIQAPPPWKGSLRDLYREAWTPWEWHAELFEHARSEGMVPFSSAFDCASVDFLETLGVDRHKVASFELCDTPLIRYMASKGKPMILSTGTATVFDVMHAMMATPGMMPSDTTLLHCVSAYPTPPAHADLDRMVGLKARFGGNVGVSDHSLGTGVAIAAAYLGATMIEKHLTLRRSDGGPDASFSMEPEEFAVMASACHELAFGRDATPSPIRHNSLNRSLWVVRDTEQGQPLILGKNVRTARPNLGLSCDYPMDSLPVASRWLRAGTPLTEDCIA